MDTMQKSNYIYEKPLFCVCGESAAGKDTLMRLLMEYFKDLIRPICSYSTRPMRDGEVEGREHYFVSKEEFKKIKEKNADDILAYTKISSKDNQDGYEYMALINELDHANLYIIDPLGLKYLKEHFEHRIPNIVVIYITSPLVERVVRAQSRSDFQFQFKNRVMNEYEQFLDFIINKEYDHIIMNHNGEQEEAFNELRMIVKRYLE